MGEEGLKPETIEKPKLEWGPDLGQMSWNEAQVKIAELNANLAEGEKPWRLPTVEELETEFKKTNSTPFGFRPDAYWSGDSVPDHDDYAEYVEMKGINFVDINHKTATRVSVRLVRDAA